MNKVKIMVLWTLITLCSATYRTYMDFGEMTVTMWSEPDNTVASYFAISTQTCAGYEHTQEWDSRQDWKDEE